jgi:SAM-dependent MidA family methyltransferase
MMSDFSAIEVVLDRINNAPQQRITFAEYMDLALYHSQVGYYANNAEVIF